MLLLVGTISTNGSIITTRGLLLDNLFGADLLVEEVAQILLRLLCLRLVIVASTGGLLLLMLLLLRYYLLLHLLPLHDTVCDLAHGRAQRLLLLGLTTT